jgi:hypothetical protein
MLSFFGVMASGPALAVLAILIFKPDFDKLLAQYPWVMTITFALYGTFVAFMFFWLQDRFMMFRPEAGVIPSSRAEVVDKLERAFNKPVEGARLFDFMAQGDRAVITWSSSLNYFQLTNVGGRGMKRVIALTFDEGKREAFFIMKDKDWRWNVSKNFFDLSLNYSTGLFAEYETEVYPSIVFSESGGLTVDLKKITYSSNELWNPIQNALLSSGWTIRGGMMPKFHQRVLFALPVGLLFFLVGFLATGLAGSTYSKMAAKRAATSTQARATKYDMDSKTNGATKSAGTSGAGTGASAGPDSSLEKMISHMPTENIKLVLDGIVKTPPKYLDQNVRNTFVTYANAYLAKKDREADFSTKVKKFASEIKVEGVRE